MSKAQLLKLVQDRSLSSDQIARRVYEQGVDFKLTPDDEAKLMEQGVEVRVLLAISLASKGVIQRAPDAPAPPVRKGSEEPPIDTGPAITKQDLISWVSGGRATLAIEHAIARRGVAFSLTADLAKELEAAGVERELLGLLALTQTVNRTAPAPAPQPAPAAASAAVPPPATAVPAPQAAAKTTSLQPAKLIRSVPPKYPMEARNEKIAGAVELEIVIRADGTVKAARAIAGHPMLAGAAEEAVRSWAFSPALVDGSPKQVTTRVTVNFVLPKKN